MKNPLTFIKDKAKEFATKLKPSPEGKVKLLNRSGYTLLAGSLLAIGFLVTAPASLTTVAGATAIGLMGLGFGALQEGDNAKYQIAMKKKDAAETPVAETPAVTPAPVAEVKPATAEFTAAAEKKPEAVAAPAVVQAPAAKPETPKAAA